MVPVSRSWRRARRTMAFPAAATKQWAIVMAFTAGHSKIGGRQKGTPNRSTAQVKAALEEVFVKLGSTDALLKFAQTNPEQFYTMWAKLLPTQVQGDPESPVQMTISWER